MQLQVMLQGVSSVKLSFFRDPAQAAQLADLVKEHGGVLGADVCPEAHSASQELNHKDWDMLLEGYAHVVMHIDAAAPQSLLESQVLVKHARAVPAIWFLFGSPYNQL